MLLIAGTSGAAAAPVGELRYGVFTDLREWNPQTQTNLIYVSPVYEGLLQMNSDGVTPEPALAESWELTARDMTFKLRQGVTFHDGARFDADAVIANIEHARKSSTGVADNISAIAKVVKLDDYAVKFELSRPNPALSYAFTQNELYMISPKTLADGSWKTAPVGTGPYVFDAAGSVPGSKYVFRYYDKYYAPENVGPALIEVYPILDDAARFNALLSGQLDAAIGDPEQREMAEAAGLKLHSWMALRHHLIILDRKELFADPLVRKAMCMAMPRPLVNEATEGGQARLLTQWPDERDPAHVADLKDYAYDIEGAKALMARAGNPKISFVLPTYQARLALGQLTQESFNKIGFDVELRVLSPGEYFSSNPGRKYPVFFNALPDEKGGMFRYYPSRFAKDGKGNAFKADPPPELARLYQEALAASVDKRPPLLREMTRIINDEALDCGFMGFPMEVYYDPKRIKTIATTNWAPSALRYKGMRMAE